MPTEIALNGVSFLEKCYIHWKTKTYGQKIEHVALILAVAIYMNKKIYQEELNSASACLSSIVGAEEDIDNIMEYIKMKLNSYQDDNEIWLADRQEAFNLIKEDENLYACMSDVFNSDGNMDESEKLFEETLKRLL